MKVLFYLVAKAEKQVDELIELSVQKMKEYLEKNSKAAELKEV